MEGGREEAGLTASPSFRSGPDDDHAVSHESPQKISAVHSDRQEVEGDGDVSEEDFEFAFVLRDPETGPPIPADEIFANGQIRPVYPVFNRDLLLDNGGKGTAAAAEPDGKTVRLPLRRLLIEERREEASGFVSSSSSSSELDELEGIPPGTYCVWTPRTAAPPLPERCRKSRSTGSSLRWRLRDLVVGRSRSDGKEKFVFLAAEEKREAGGEDKGKEAAVAEERKKGKEEETRKKGLTKGRATRRDLVTAHRMYYGRSRDGKGNRRSYLPYKQGIVGFFANVNGLARTHNAL